MVLPGVWRSQRKEKADKIIQLGRRVFGVSEADPDKAIDLTIEAVKGFFMSLGIKATKEEYGVTDEIINEVARIIDSRGIKFGDLGNIDGKKIIEILNMCD